LKTATKFSSFDGEVVKMRMKPAKVKRKVGSYGTDAVINLKEAEGKQ
jgi:hypothetical protein